MEKIIDMARTLSTQELETLIADLADLRAEMTPEVSRKPPTSADARLSVQESPAIIMGAAKDGRIRLSIRNEGLGWLIFILHSELAVLLRDFLIASTDKDARPILFSQQDGNGGAAH